jgi:P27 family predicted phage terminase small subunit
MLTSTADHRETCKGDRAGQSSNEAGPQYVRPGKFSYSQLRNIFLQEKYMSNPRVSDEIKDLRGTNRADRQKKALAGERLTEPVPAPDTASGPAKKEWDKLMPILVELGTVCRADLRAFEQLCETLATQTALQTVIEAEGCLLKTGNGSFKTNPAMRSLETARNQAKALYTEFGLTPKARSYVSAAPAPVDKSKSVFRTIPR